MDGARIELKLVLEQAGVDGSNLDSFSRRFNIQKRVYLIQINGYDLGYRFGWYLRGPYSRDLTADAFALRDELSEGVSDFEEYVLGDVGKHRIQRAQNLSRVPEGLNVDPDQWLELLASLHYLKHIAYWPTGETRNFDGVFAKLVDSKPQFRNARETALAAWSRLNEYGLIDHKTIE